MSPTPIQAPNQTANRESSRKGKKSGVCTGFVVYSATVHAKLRAENPTLSFGEISKMIGEQWRALEPSEKKTYEDKARETTEQNKERIQKEEATAQEAARVKQEQQVQAQQQAQIQQPMSPSQNSNPASSMSGQMPVRPNQADSPNPQINYVMKPSTATPVPPAKQIKTAHEYPEGKYEAPKPLFINPPTTNRKVLHSRIYQNYLERMGKGCRTLTDFNSYPVKIQDKNHYTYCFSKNSDSLLKKSNFSKSCL